MLSFWHNDRVWNSEKLFKEYDSNQYESLKTIQHRINVAYDSKNSANEKFTHRYNSRKFLWNRIRRKEYTMCMCVFVYVCIFGYIYVLYACMCMCVHINKYRDLFRENLNYKTKP